MTLESFCGYEDSIVTELCAAYGAFRDDVIIALTTMHMNLKNQQLGLLHPYLAMRWGTDNMAKRAAAVLAKAGTCGVVDPRIRFRDYRPELPDITCVVDGTPIPSSGDVSVLKNHKYKYPCWKFEVYFTVAGIPFSIKGPFVPSDHDAKIFADKHGCPTRQIPFDHWEEEAFLGDKGYIGLPHCVTPFKGGGDATAEEGEDGELPLWKYLVNKQMHNPPAYIEHGFADMKRHDMFRCNRRGVDTLYKYARLYLDAEYLKALRSPRYAHCVKPRPERSWGRMCPCATDSEARTLAVLNGKVSRLRIPLEVQCPECEWKVPEGEGTRKKRKKK